MPTPRLPIPGQDSGDWGNILNEFLLVAHENDGKLKGEDLILGKANSADLAAIATTGSYNDLIDIPVNQDLSSLVNLTQAQTISGAKNFTGGLNISGSAAVATNDARLNDTRTPTDNTVSTAKVQDASITEPKLAVSNTPTDGDFLSWDGSSLTWEAQGAAPVTSVNTRTGAIVLAKGDVGLGNVDNTTDAAKPVSAATQTALNLKANSASLSTVATTGSYSNLLDKPTLSTVAASGAYSDLTGKPSLSTVATSGSYADLTNKPTIPNDAGLVHLAGTETVTGEKNFTGGLKISGTSLSSVATSGAYADLSGKPTLSTVAASGAYADLSGKPTLPTAGTGSSNYAVGDDSRINGAIQSSLAIAKGDILAATGTNTITRVGVGNNNQVLTADNSQAGGVKWADVAGGGGGSGITRSIVTLSSNQTASAAASTDYIYILTGNYTLTLPTAVGNTNKYVVKNRHTASVALAFNASENADGGGITLSANSSVDLVSDGSNWVII
ncbi:MAG: hypothetical protein V4611_00315 [Patescibacteria group bacterium]